MQPHKIQAPGLPSESSTQATPRTFTIHTSTLPDIKTDTPVLQDVVTRSFGAKSLAGSAAAAVVAAAAATASTGQEVPSDALTSFSARVRSIRQQNVLEGRNADGRRSLVGMAMHDASGEVVGMVSLLAPAPKWHQANSYPEGPEIPLLSAADSGSDVPAGGQSIVDMYQRSDVQSERRNVELLGTEWKKEWWYLSALAVVPEFQRLGLGGRLVRWAVEQVGADVEQRRVRGDAGIKGLCLIAASGALATYAREGLVKIGEGWLGGDGIEGAGDDADGGTEKSRGRLFTWMTLEM